MLVGKKFNLLKNYQKHCSIRTFCISNPVYVINKFYECLDAISFEKDRDLGFINSYDSLLVADDYLNVDSNLDYQLKIAFDLKMFYLLFVFNIYSHLINFLSNCKGVINSNITFTTEIRDSYVSYTRVFLNYFMNVYFVFFFNDINKQFSITLDESDINMSDFRYIILNILQKNGLLNSLVELELIPNVDISDQTSLLFFPSVVNLVELKNKIITIENMPIPLVNINIFFSADYLLKIERLENKGSKELIFLSLNYIKKFDKELNGELYSTKFLKYNCLLFVYNLLYFLLVNVVTAEDLSRNLDYIIHSFNVSCNYLSIWFDNRLGFSKSNDKLPVSLLLEIYGSSEVFMKAFNNYLINQNNNSFVGFDYNGYILNLKNKI